MTEEEPICSVDSYLIREQVNIPIVVDTYLLEEDDYILTASCLFLEYEPGYTYEVEVIDNKYVKVLDTNIKSTDKWFQVTASSISNPEISHTIDLTSAKNPENFALLYEILYRSVDNMFNNGTEIYDGVVYLTEDSISQDFGFQIHSMDYKDGNQYMLLMMEHALEFGTYTVENASNYEDTAGPFHESNYAKMLPEFLTYEDVPFYAIADRLTDLREVNVLSAASNMAGTEPFVGSTYEMKLGIAVYHDDADTPVDWLIKSIEDTSEDAPYVSYVTGNAFAYIDSTLSVSGLELKNGVMVSTLTNPSFFHVNEYGDTPTRIMIALDIS